MTLNVDATGSDKEIESGYNLGSMLHCLIHVWHFSTPSGVILKVILEL